MRDRTLKLWINTVLRLVSGTYFVLTSLYCLLAFLPYTYCAFIKAPPYPWMPWFTHHQAALYWAAAAAGAIAANGAIFAASRRSKEKELDGAIGLLVAFGIYLSINPFLPALPNKWEAYWWSLASLL